jgi:hypothetical protein
VPRVVASMPQGIGGIPEESPESEASPITRGSMLKALIPAALALLLAGCGLAEVGVAGATAATSAAEQAKQGKETEARVQQQVNAAMQQDAANRKAAEDAAVQ